jgi:3-oxoacyl-[acyl-carrier-protein] synthase-3
MATRIIGCGSYLPERVLTNEDLAKTIDTNDDWIRSRTGISKRHIARPEEYSSHMGFEAAKRAIFNAGIDLSDIDLLIVATTTPDNSFPSVASKIHGYLALNSSVPAFDIQAVCAGFIYGLHVADCMIKTGQYKNVLFVSVDKMSSLLDWQDRSTCVLFGDGAGAVILKSDSNTDCGIIATKLYADGSMFNILYTDGGVSSNAISGTIKMSGGDVFKQAVQKMGNAVELLLKEHNLTPEDIDYFIPHQANIRIIDALAKKFAMPKEKVVTTVQIHANCSSASIPLALTEIAHLLKPGNIIVFAAFGAGTAWGAGLLKW